MFKNFFIVGMRRSGTSVLRKLLMKHPQIGDIEFEPHPLWNAVDLLHFRRWRDYPGVHKTIQEFRDKGRGDGWHGAKFALNPGVKAMEWVWLPKIFPEAKIIFIIRNPTETYKSYYKQDKNVVRGYVPERIYTDFWNIIVEGFNGYLLSNPRKACSIVYESLIKKADEELEKIWALFEIEKRSGFQKYIRKPENWSKDQ